MNITFHTLITRGQLAAEAYTSSLAAAYEREIRRLGRDAAATFLIHQNRRGPTPRLAAAGEQPDWQLPHPDEMLNIEAAARQMSTKTGPLRQQIAHATIGPTLAHYGFAFDLKNPLIGSVFTKMGQKITHITDTVRSDVMGAIQSGYDDGLSIRDTAQLIRTTVNQMSKTRAEMIARTEMTAATSGASWAAARLVSDASPPAAQLRKIWIATEDDRTREAHAEAADTYGEGAGIPLDQPFIVDGEELLYPGDDGSPENTINCRCTVGYEQGEAALTAGGVIPRGVPATLHHEQTFTLSQHTRLRRLIQRTTSAGMYPDDTLRAVPRDPIFPVRLDPDMKERLTSLAEAHGISLAEAMREGAAALLAAPLTVTGKAGLPLGDREESWDAAAAQKTLNPDQYGDAFFYRDPEGDPAAVGSYKLGFAKNDNGLHAVWSGITAVAAALQGSRGGVDIPAADQDTIKGKVAAYYAAAAKKYDDDTITPPWDSSAANEEAPMTPDPATLAPGDMPSDEGPTDDPSTLDQLADVAAQIVHCPDYGDAYWNADTGDVYWIACDGDPYPAAPGGGTDGEDVPAGTPFDEIESMFKAVPGVQSVTIEAETPPPDDAGYVPVLEEGDGGDVNPAPIGDENPGQDGTGLAAEPSLYVTVPGVEFTPVDADGFRVLSFDVAPTETPPTGEQGDSPAPVEVTAGVPFRATLAIEGKPTDDGRMIEEGALGWRELPLTLMATIEDSHGGVPQNRTVVSGRIDSIDREKVDGEDFTRIIGTGFFDTGEHGSEIARLVTEKMLRGVSIDLAVQEQEEVTGEPGADVPDGAVEDPMFGGSYLLVVKKGLIMGATICPFAAFGEADIEAVIAAAYGDADKLPAWMMPRIHLTADGSVDQIVLLGQFEVVPTDSVPPAPTGDTGGGMIAVYPAPDEATALADPDGNIPPDGLHCTLFHFPQMPDPDTLAQLVDDFAQGYSAITGQVGGSGVFAPGEDDDGKPNAPYVLLIDAPGLGELRFDLADALEGAGITYSEDHDFTPHITTDYDDPADQAVDASLVGQAVTFAAISIVTEAGDRQDVPLAASLTASAAGLVPVAPPVAWFEYPADLDGNTLIPLTVTDEGQVYGHIAAFNECHIGSPAGKCLTAPHHYRKRDDNLDGCAVCGEREAIPNHSRSGYDFFHLGEIETAEGELVRVGQVTLATTHAPTAAGTSARMAQQHYDNTGTSAVDGKVYEDNVGPFLAGALRPDMPAAKVRELRAAKPSGDWRGIKGRRELIGVLAVNKPGFPIVRRSTRIEDGETRELALVAAGFPDPAAYGTAPCSDEVASEIAALIASGRGEQTVADLVAEVRLPELLAEARE